MGCVVNVQKDLSSLGHEYRTAASADAAYQLFLRG